MRTRINGLLVLGIALVITAASLGPILSGDATGTVFQFGHFILYFLLAASLLLYFHDTPRGHREAVLAAGTFGLLLELVQFHLPFRSFSAADVAVNFLGASVVLLDHRSGLVSFVVEKEDELIERYLIS